jgi:hypothetical protein
MSVYHSGIEGWSEDDETALKQLVKKRLSLRRGTKDNGDIKFVSDLLAGEEAEKGLAKALKTGEIKRDFGTGKTGNVYVEVESFGKPSGVTTTKADFWFFALAGDGYNDEIIIGVKTSRLKKILDKITWVTWGGTKSKGKLLPIRTLIKPNEEPREEGN